MEMVHVRPYVFSVFILHTFMCVNFVESLFILFIYILFIYLVIYLFSYLLCCGEAGQVKTTYK